MIDISEVLPRHLYLGRFPDAPYLPHLKKIGVTAILSLIHPTDGRQVSPEIKQAFVWDCVPIKDSYQNGLPSVGQLEEAVQILKGWRSEGHVIYLHCLEGKGRSPLVAMAYLVMGNEEEKNSRRHRLTEAIYQVRKARPSADPNVHQLLILCQYVENYYPLDILFI